MSKSGSPRKKGSLDSFTTEDQYEALSSLPKELQSKLILKAMTRDIRNQLGNAFQYVTEDDFEHIPDLLEASDLPEEYRKNTQFTSFGFRLKGGERKELFIVTFPNNEKGKPDFAKTPFIEVIEPEKN